MNIGHTLDQVSITYAEMLDIITEKYNAFMNQESVQFVIFWAATIAAVVVGVSTFLYRNITKALNTRIRTPEKIDEIFYFNYNPKAYSGDEVVGLSIGRLYFGVYTDSINWGVLNENGAL